MTEDGIKNLIDNLRGTEEPEVLHVLEERIRQIPEAERSNLKISEARKLLSEVRSENPQAVARQRAAFLGANVPFNS